MKMVVLRLYTKHMQIVRNNHNYVQKIYKAYL